MWTGTRNSVRRRVAAGEETLLRRPSEATVAVQLPPGAPTDQRPCCSSPKRSRKTHVALKISRSRSVDKTSTAEATRSDIVQAMVHDTRQSKPGPLPSKRRRKLGRKKHLPALLPEMCCASSRHFIRIL